MTETLTPPACSMLVSAASSKAMPGRTREVFAHLVKCALDMHTVTYGELAKATGLPAQGMGHQLDFIHYEVCIPRGLPWIAALAVNTASRRPSTDWSGTWNFDGSSVESDAIWRMAVAQVLSFPGWEHVTL